MRAGRLAVAMMLALAGAQHLAAREPPEGLVGLLSPPMVPDGPPGCVRVAADERQALFAAPREDAPRTGWLVFIPWREGSRECDAVLPHFEATGGTARQSVPSLESGYEVVALAVLEQRGEWLRLDLGQSSGWLRRPGSHLYEPYPALLPGKLAYATPAWRGELCTSAGSGCRTLDVEAGQALNVLSAASGEGEAWVEVELTTEPCRDGEPVVLHHGWIRASVQGRPTVWFHSRGC